MYEGTKVARRARVPGVARVLMKQATVGTTAGKTLLVKSRIAIRHWLRFYRLLLKQLSTVERHHPSDFPDVARDW